MADLLSTEKEQHNILKSAEVLLHQAESKHGDAIKKDDMDKVGPKCASRAVGSCKNALQERGGCKNAAIELCLVADK